MVQNEYEIILKKLHIVLRDEKIRMEYEFLLRYAGLSGKAAKERLAEQAYYTPEGTKYYLTVKRIEGIIYPLKKKGDNESNVQQIRTQNKPKKERKTDF